MSDNIFDTTVEVFPDADCIVVDEFLADGFVSASPANSETGTVWVGMCVMGTRSNLEQCKYPVLVRDTDKAEQ